MKLFFFFSVCAWAQLEQPRLGVMLDSAGAARPVFGVSASVTIGDPVASGVISMACAARVCAAKTNTAILVWSDSWQKSVPAPDGPAQFAFDRETIYVYSSGQLARWRNSIVDPVALNVTGEILSMRVIDGSLEFAVRRDDGTWIVRDGDLAISAIPDATGPVMLLDSAILFAAGDETVLRRADATEVRFPIHADSFTPISTRYVQIQSGASNYALRIASEKLFQLPEAQ